MIVSVRDQVLDVGDDHGAFWHRVARQDWEPDSYAVLDAFLSPDQILIDIGAWIGPLTLYAAAKGVQVLAYEPDPAARAELMDNLARNPEVAQRVTVSPLAVGRGRGGRRLGNITSTRGGDSMSSLLFGDAAVGWPVESVGLVDVLADVNLDRLGLIKIDIEGAEVELLDAAADLLATEQPSVFLSVHARFWKPDPWPRLYRLAEILGGYDVLLTPTFQPFPASDVLADPYATGLFELIACRSAARP